VRFDIYCVDVDTNGDIAFGGQYAGTYPAFGFYDNTLMRPRWLYYAYMNGIPAITYAYSAAIKPDGSYLAFITMSNWTLWVLNAAGVLQWVSYQGWNGGYSS
jgi:hypothetical protein